MLSGENIICFSKDYTEDPTSNNHVVRLLAQSNRILWINSISTRAPQFSSGKDMRKIVKKVQSFIQGVRQIERNLWVFTPIVVPLPHNPIAMTINEQILKLSIALLRRKLGMGSFQLWSFIPTATPYIGTMGESFVVYYCTDEYSQFSYVESEKIKGMEEELCRKANVVFATAHSLVENKKRLNTQTYLASHGVDYPHFAQALDDNIEVAPELAKLPKPIIGFFGLVHSWFDQKLVAYLAEQRPQWSFVLIGKQDVDIALLKQHKNIHLLGRKPYDELPRFCKGFSAGIIPFVVNELTRHVNPIKLREYLSAGLPVVSTYLPEVRFYSDLCEVANSYESFLTMLQSVIENDSPEARLKRSKAMTNETWEAKVAALGDIIHKVQKVTH